MARSPHVRPAEQSARPAEPGGRALLVLARTTVILIAAQFVLAAFGAFAMDKTPSDNAYGPHAVLGLIIAAMTLVILVVVLASRAARTHRRTVWPAVSLAVLSVAVQPALGTAGTKVPAVGALHGLNAVVILALAAWLAIETARRRAAASRPSRNAATGPAARENSR